MDRMIFFGGKHLQCVVSDHVEHYHAEVLLPICRVKESSVLSGHRPRTIDRTALIVRPKQPYVDWVNSVDYDGPRAILQELRTDPSIYLFEAIDCPEGFDLLVNDTWEWIFREQLNGWIGGAELWPEGLTREMFLEWFDCELSTMIWDMLKRKTKPAL